MEWKKIDGMEYGKIVFHSIPLHALVLGFSRGNNSVSHHNANTVVKLKHITRYHCVKIKGVILRQVCYTQFIFH